MSIGVRIFFIEDDNNLRPIPLKRLERLINGDKQATPLPEYAGKRMRYAFVILEVKNRKHVEIKAINGYTLKFDSQGQVDRDEWNKQTHGAVDILPLGMQKIGSVINASQRFNKKRYNHEFLWKPTLEIIKVIEGTIFGSKHPSLKLV